MQSSVTPDPALDELSVTLETVLRDLTRALRADADYGGLSVTAAVTLGRLLDGPLRISALTALEGVSQPSMTALIGRLEGRGLVQRGPDAEDGRAVLVSLTAAGERRVAELLDARVAALRARLAAAGPADRDTLADAIPALRRLLEAP